MKPSWGCALGCAWRDHHPKKIPRLMTFIPSLMTPQHSCALNLNSHLHSQPYPFSQTHPSSLIACFITPLFTSLSPLTHLNSCGCLYDVYTVLYLNLQPELCVQGQWHGPAVDWATLTRRSAPNPGGCEGACQLPAILPCPNQFTRT